MIRSVDIEIYDKDDEWSQGRYLAHGHDDCLWTDSADDALFFIAESLKKEHDND